MEWCTESLGRVNRVVAAETVVMVDDVFLTHLVLSTTRHRTVLVMWHPPVAHTIHFFPPYWHCLKSLQWLNIAYRRKSRIRYGLWGSWGSSPCLGCQLHLSVCPCGFPAHSTPPKRDLCSSCPSKYLHSLNIPHFPISQPFFYFLSRICLSHTSQDNPTYPSVLSEILPPLGSTSWWPSLGPQSTPCFFPCCFSHCHSELNSLFAHPSPSADSSQWTETVYAQLSSQSPAQCLI